MTRTWDDTADGGTFELVLLERNAELRTNPTGTRWLHRARHLLHQAVDDGDGTRIGHMRASLEVLHADEDLTGGQAADVWGLLEEANTGWAAALRANEPFGFAVYGPEHRVLKAAAATNPTRRDGLATSAALESPELWVIGRMVDHKLLGEAAGITDMFVLQLTPLGRQVLYALDMAAP